jgi:hypothetical protein
MPIINISRPLFCFMAGILLLHTIPLKLQAQLRAEFDWYSISDSLQKDFGPIVLRQRVGENQYIGVKPSSICQECEDYGIRHQLASMNSDGS